MEKTDSYVIFGAGDLGRRALDLVGKENTAFFVDNDVKKDGIEIDGVPVKLFGKVASELPGYRVIIAVAKKHVDSIQKQLAVIGVNECDTFIRLWQAKVRKDIENRRDFIGVYQKALQWIDEHTVVEDGGKSIICTTDLPYGYPEVTGYYIPTLIRIGKRELAIDFAKWLVSIQHEDGAWYDTENKAPYVFDTAQILKGLIAVRRIVKNTDEVDAAIRKGSDWIASNMQPDGRLTTPDDNIVNTTKECTEAIHLYCLSPLVEAAEMFGEERYKIAAEKILAYYKKNYGKTISEWGKLTHFYAYIMEALLDLGEVNIVREAMSKVAQCMKADGSVPAYPNVNWVCSTGLFQLALVWFRLGEVGLGNKAFEAACNLQNDTGGWYGSYISEGNMEEENDYFPMSEISWAVKYFFDALYYKNIMDFNEASPMFHNNIERGDGRYKIICDCVNEKCIADGGRVDVLDVGCSKGRYLKNLLEDVPEGEYYGVDISDKVLEIVNEPKIHLRVGTLTYVPFEDDSFDVVLACEALEHAIDIKGAIRELARVVKSDGYIIVVDKNREALGAMEISPWEQWFDESALKHVMEEYCTEVVVHSHVPYEDVEESTLFSVWVGRVR